MPLYSKSTSQLKFYFGILLDQVKHKHNLDSFLGIDMTLVTF